MINTKVIDLLCRQRKHLPLLLGVKEENRVAAEEETKMLIEELARLKYELQTNKPLKELVDDLSDKTKWNEHLKREEDRLGTDGVLWFNVSWLYAECYFYRRMREIFAVSQYFKKFDPFYLIKEEAFFGSLSFADILAEKLLRVSSASSSSTTIAEECYHFVMVRMRLIA